VGNRFKKFKESQSLKVLHIINGLSLGGAEKMLTEILLENKKNNCYEEHSVFILNNTKSIFTDRLIEANVKLITPRSNKFSNVLYLFKTIKSYQVIHAHLFPSLYIVALLSFFCWDKTYIFTEHNSYNRRRDKSYLRFLERLVYSRYSSIIAISESTRLNLLKWLGTKFYSKVITINNGVNLNQLTSVNDLPIEYLGPEDTFKMLMVGSFTPQKDQHTIIRALLRLPAHVVLYLVGEGVQRAELEGLVVELSLTERVFFLGARNDIPEVMHACDLVIQSSHWEGFGLVAVEAMAAGKVIIASNVDGLRQVVDGYGLIFDRGLDEHLASLVIKLLEDEKYMEELREKCKKRSLDFSIESLVEKYNQLYSKFIL
jgi:hypothetical protein